MTKLIQKIFNKETVTYIIFGVLTTIVDFGVFSLLYYCLDINEIAANTLAWTAAVIFSFISSKLFVFDAKCFKLKTLLREFTGFVLSRIVTLVLTDAFLIFAGYISMNMLLAKAIISVFVIIINYIFSKLLIFRNDNTGGNL
jgi:putative flippase GtrA